MKHRGKAAFARAAAGLVLFGIAAGPAIASENGNEHYPIGVDTAAPALVTPPPGKTVWLNYDQWYTAGSFAGSNGNKLVPGFHLNVYANAFRFIHTWNMNYKGVTFSSQIIPLILDINVHAEGHHTERFSFGDLNIVPIYISYKTGNLHLLLGPNIWVPTGYYKVNDPASGGLNYFTFAPQITATWFPSPRWEVSLSTMTQFNTTNPDTHYHSGNSFDVDYAVNYQPFQSLENLHVGIIGNAYTQWTDDSIHGTRVPGGNRGRVFSVGPQALYHIGPGGLLVKWEHEFGVENMPNGERLWLQFKVSL
jgi:hypothetical protein